MAWYTINFYGCPMYEQVINHFLLSVFLLAYFLSTWFSMFQEEYMKIFKPKCWFIYFSMQFCSLLVYISGLYYAVHIWPWWLYLNYGSLYEHITSFFVLKIYPSYSLSCLRWKLLLQLSFASKLPSCIFFILFSAFLSSCYLMLFNTPLNPLVDPFSR